MPLSDTGQLLESVKEADLHRWVERLSILRHGQMNPEALEETGATLVFATTTPVPEGRVRPYRKPQDVVRYNGMGVSLAMSRGIAVNDLYAFVLPRLGELQRPGNVHFLPAGTRALAKEVVRAIRAAAE